MTREEAKELLPIIQAFVEGKSIQNKIEGLTGWIDTDEIYPEYDGQKVMYRIKPESKYRPFKSKDECWEEMLKHEPFGWIIKGDRYINALYVGNDRDFVNWFETYKFADGMPLGVKEE